MLGRCGRTFCIRIFIRSNFVSCLSLANNFSVFEFFFPFRLVCAAHKSIRVGVRLGEYDTTKEIDCLGNNCADPVLYMGVDEKIPHERYNERSKNRENDIGLVRLNADVTYTDYIKPICLPTTVNSPRGYPNERLVSAGWGRTLDSNAIFFCISGKR